MARPRSQAGFTLVELMTSVVITVMVVTATLVGFVFLLQSGNMNNNQTELDIDVRKAMDNLQHDLRLTSVDRILFYPAGPGPYTAMSFPMALPNNLGMLNYGTNGLIQWDQTVVYHVWSGQPNQLRRTVFSPRNNVLTDEQRQEQLNSVVVNGNGLYTYDSGTASTRTIFNNLVQWVIKPQNASFDGYSSVVTRSAGFDLGAFLLDNGAHQFKFTVVGKNPLNTSGYSKIGIDTLVMSPSGLEREAEAQTPTTPQSGASAVAEYMPNGGWSGNYRLMFPATATGQYFTLTMNNDCWEETNFRGSGSATSNTVVKFDTNATPYDFVVQLEGPGTAWQAADQTLDSAVRYTTGDALRGCAVRVLVRGKDMLNGGCLKLSGATHLVYFQAPTNGDLKIEAAYIAECSSSTNFSMNAVDNGVPLLFNAGSGLSSSINIQSGGIASAWPQGGIYAIDKNKSYLISYLVSQDAAHADARCWVENNLATPGCWVLPAALNPDTTMTRAAVWSGLGVQTNLLCGVASIYTFCPTNGTYISQAVDTHLTSPSYQTISWHSVVPAGSTLGLCVRSASTADGITNATWSSPIAAGAPSGSSSLGLGGGRYVQYMALFTPNNFFGLVSPQLKDIRIAWTGNSQVVDLGGIFSKGPDHGIFELTVDGSPILKGCTMNMTIYKDVPVAGGGYRRLISSVAAELYPRNTGK